MQYHKKRNASKPLCIGRANEFSQIAELVADPSGLAILVIGQQGMGKTVLLNSIAYFAEQNPALKCGVVRYTITPTDSADSCLSLIMDDLYKASRVVRRSTDPSKQTHSQVRALLNIIPSLGDLLYSLKRNPQQCARDALILRLELLSARMSHDARAIIIIDPEKSMVPGSEQAWAMVTKHLPRGFKLLIAQRPDDVVASSSEFCCISNVHRVPQDCLSPLSVESVDELISVVLPSHRSQYVGIRDAISRLLRNSVQGYHS